MNYAVHTSYHVHSTWSDGASTLEEYLEAAPATGFAEWGFSDHIVMHPDGIPVSWSMDPARLPAYVAAVREIQAGASAGQPVRLEIDYFPGQEAALETLLGDYPFDFIMGSVHYLGGFCIDNNLAHWKTLSPTGVNDAWRSYFERIGGLARSGLFSFIAHLDLPKAFDFRPTEDISREIGATLDAVAKAGLAVEVNTAGWNRACREAYPFQDILAGCLSRGIPALVNADAHASKDLDLAGVLARGTPEEVRADTREHIEALAGNGGYIVASSHSITDDVPPENYRAMIETAWRSGACS
jgi:histidinol-phosphatase (PHP family)